MYVILINCFRSNREQLLHSFQAVVYIAPAFEAEV